MTVLVFDIDKVIKYWGVPVVTEKWTFSLSVVIDHKISNKLWQRLVVLISYKGISKKKAYNFQCYDKNIKPPLFPSSLQKKKKKRAKEKQ